MGDRDALFRAIVANPDEDLPRLIFADAIEADGEEEYAEFIRLQCEMGRLEDDGSDTQSVYEFLAERDTETLAAIDWSTLDPGMAHRLALHRRTNELYQAHHQDWTKWLPKECGLQWGAFARGFPGQASLTEDREKFILRCASEQTALPALTLSARSLTAALADAIVQGGVLRSICGLKLSGHWLAGLRVLSRSPDAAGIHTLKIHDSTIEEAEAIGGLLAGSSHWRGLRNLDLSNVWMPYEAAQELYHASHLQGLKRLSLAGGAWGINSLDGFVRSHFTSLVDLTLRRTSLDDADAEALASMPQLASLRSLDLGYNSIGGAGATALLASPHLKSLAFISFMSNPVRSLDAKRLATAPAGGLRVFHGHDCQFTVADVRALTRSPRFDELWYLDLDGNQLGNSAVREVTRGLGKRCPPALWMIQNEIDAEGARLLAAWPHAKNLQALQLQGNPLGNAGVRALLDSPRLAGLRSFGASQVSAPLEQAIRSRFGQHANVW